MGSHHRDSVVFKVPLQHCHLDGGDRSSVIYRCAWGGADLNRTRLRVNRVRSLAAQDRRDPILLLPESEISNWEKSQGGVARQSTRRGLSQAQAYLLPAESLSTQAFFTAICREDLNTHILAIGL
jgi:hypothetical protein